MVKNNKKPYASP